MEIFTFRKGRGIQISIWAKHWRIAIALFCCGKIVGLLPCPMCDRYLCRYEDN